MRGLFAIFALGIASALHASVPSNSIGDFVAAEMPTSGTPGLAYAIIEDGDVQTFAQGVLETGSSTPVTPDTAFGLASVSKSFTALAIMQLVESGQLDLDASVAQYLDVFAGRPSAAITVRQLLSHTSGFSTMQGNAAHADQNSAEVELAQHVEQIAGWPLAHTPGQVWEYSNANYQVLGALIETVSGQDYAAYVEEHILDPIGMENSFVAREQISGNLATGHRPWFAGKRPYHSDGGSGRIFAPAGGVMASVHDLARYMAMMMNGQDDVISAQSKLEMLQPASDASPFYGFGWFLDSETGEAYHTGLSPGFESVATLLPAEGKAAIVLVNANSGIGFAEMGPLLSGISGRALGIERPGAGSRWSQKAMFLSLLALPPLFLISMIWAWVARRKLRAKSGPFGLFSLWFPLLTTGGIAFALAFLMPSISGTSLSTLHLYQPGLTVALIATAATGVIWAIFRLGVAYTGKPARITTLPPS